MGAGAGGLSQHLDNAEEKLQWISKIPCFAPLSHDTLLALAAQVTVLNYSKGEYIIEQGQVGSLFGILVQGVVQISAIGPSGAAVILCSQYRGFYFGEAAIVGNTTTTATITASEDCIVFGLRSHELQRLAVTNPAIKESLLQILSYRLKQNLLSIPFFAKLQVSRGEGRREGGECAERLVQKALRRTRCPEGAIRMPRSERPAHSQRPARNSGSERSARNLLLKTCRPNYACTANIPL